VSLGATALSGPPRSATDAGIAPSYNVLDGFEGNLDAQGHRGEQAGGHSVCLGNRAEAAMTDSDSVRTPKALPDGVSQATVGVRGGLLRSGFEETAEAMFLTSGLRPIRRRKSRSSRSPASWDHFVYSRYGNPTVTMFEERLRLIEGAPAAFATASGMAAVFHLAGRAAGAGDRLVAARSLFGSCFVVCNEILPRWVSRTVLVDAT